MQGLQNTHNIIDFNQMNTVSTRPISESPTSLASAAANNLVITAHHPYNHSSLHSLNTLHMQVDTGTVSSTKCNPPTINAITTALLPLSSDCAVQSSGADTAAKATSDKSVIFTSVPFLNRIKKNSMAVTSTVPPVARSVSPSVTSAVGAPPGTPYSNLPPVSATLPTSALPSSAVASVLGALPSSNNTGAGVGQTNSNGANRCCETGRTIYTDPVSGQTLCSCQYEMLNYQRLAAGGLVTSAPGGVPLGVYPESMSAYLTGMPDQAPFYTNPTGIDLKENLVTGSAPWPYPSVYHPYDAAFAGYPFNSYGMDLNGARRKNATRETTSTLKAWLNEHKKNPYPTKGEKIMLAIITKMTLTQVSTWFANARRRLKKENKMTWEPRNRVDDDEANIDDDDHKSCDENDLLDAKDSGLGSNEDKDRSGRLDLLSGDRPGESNNSEWSGSRQGSPNGSPDLYDRGNPSLIGSSSATGHPLFHSAGLHQHFLPPASSPPDIAAYHHQQQLLQQNQHHQQQQAHPNSLHAVGIGASGINLGNTSVSLVTKPRIWSLADMASKDVKDSGVVVGTTTPKGNQSPTEDELQSSHQALYSHHSQHASHGKILSPLAARIPNYAPYGRPDIYRGFYGCSLNSGPTPEFLEHQRSFSASLSTQNGLGMNPLIWKAAVSGAAAGNSHFAPLSLTTSHNHSNSYAVPPPSGTSPSASSTSSSTGCDVVQLPFSGLSQSTLSQQQFGTTSGNSTISSSASSNSGQISPSINVTSIGSCNSGKP